MNIALLDRLRAAAGDYRTARTSWVLTSDSVRADLDALDSFGFAIERHPYRGAAYAGPAERLCPDQIEHELATRRVGRRIAVWSRVSSTNDLAARAGGSASNDGLVVLAEEQTAGRGRRGRSWTAPPRSSILMSVLLFPPRDLDPGRARLRRGLRLADRAGCRGDRRGRLRLDRPRGRDQVAQRRPRRRPEDRRNPGRAPLAREGAAPRSSASG